MPPKEVLSPEEAYLRHRSGKKAAEIAFYGEAAAIRVVHKVGVETGAPGRNPISFAHRIALASLFGELQESYVSAWEVFRQLWSYDPPFGETTAYRILKNSREFKPQVYGVAAIVERRDNADQILAYRERGEAVKYGKLVGDLTIPMGFKGGKREPHSTALRRMIRWELFDGTKIGREEWRQHFSFPYGEEPLGYFAVADCQVGLFVLRLETDEAQLGGFSSQKVKGHQWVDVDFLARNEEFYVRRGVKEMVAHYVRFKVAPEEIDRRATYLTSLNHTLAGLP